MNQGDLIGRKFLKKDPEIAWQRLIKFNIDSMVSNNVNDRQSKLASFTCRSRSSAILDPKKRPLNIDEDEQINEKSRQQISPQLSKKVKYSAQTEYNNISDDLWEVKEYKKVDLFSSDPLAAEETDAIIFRKATPNLKYEGIIESDVAKNYSDYDIENGESKVNNELDDSFKALHRDMHESSVESRSSVPSKENERYNQLNLSSIKSVINTPLQTCNDVEAKSKIDYVLDIDYTKISTLDTNSTIICPADTSFSLLDPDAHCASVSENNQIANYHVLSSKNNVKEKTVHQGLGNVETNIVNHNNYKNSSTADESSTEFKHLHLVASDKEQISKLIEIVQADLDNLHSNNICGDKMQILEHTNKVTRKDRLGKNTIEKGITEIPPKQGVKGSEKIYGQSVKIQEELIDSNLNGFESAEPSMESTSALADASPTPNLCSFSSSCTLFTNLEKEISNTQDCLKIDAQESLRRTGITCNEDQDNSCMAQATCKITAFDEKTEAYKNIFIPQKSSSAITQFMINDINLSNKDTVAYEKEGTSVYHEASCNNKMIFVNNKQNEDVNTSVKDYVLNTKRKGIKLNSNSKDYIETDLGRKQSKGKLKTDIARAKNLVQSPTTPWKRLMEVNINSMLEIHNRDIYGNSGTRIADNSSFSTTEDHKSQSCYFNDSKDLFLGNDMSSCGNDSHFQDGEKHFDPKDLHKADFEDRHEKQTLKAMKWLNSCTFVDNLGICKNQSHNKSQNTINQDKDSRGIQLSPIKASAELNQAYMSQAIPATWSGKTVSENEKSNSSEASDLLLEPDCNTLGGSATKEANKITFFVLKENAEPIKGDNDIDIEAYETTNSASSEAIYISDDDRLIKNDKEAKNGKCGIGISTVKNYSNPYLCPHYYDKHETESNFYTKQNAPCSNNQLSAETMENSISSSVASSISKCDVHRSDKNMSPHATDFLSLYSPPTCRDTVINSNVCDSTVQLNQNHTRRATEKETQKCGNALKSRSDLDQPLVDCDVSVKNVTIDSRRKDISGEVETEQLYHFYSDRNLKDKIDDFNYEMKRDQQREWQTPPLTTADCQLSDNKDIDEEEVICKDYNIFSDEESEENLYLNVLLDEGKIIDRRDSTSALPRDKYLVHSPTTPWRRLVETNINSLIGSQNREPFVLTCVSIPYSVHANNKGIATSQPLASEISNGHNLEENISVGDAVSCIKKSDLSQPLTRCIPKESTISDPTQFYLTETKDFDPLLEETSCHNLVQLEKKRSSKSIQGTTDFAIATNEYRETLLMSPNCSSPIDAQIELNSDQTLFSYRHSQEFPLPVQSTQGKPSKAIDYENVSPDNFTVNSADNKKFRDPQIMQDSRFSTVQNSEHIEILNLSTDRIDDSKALELSKKMLTHGQSGEGNILVVNDEASTSHDSDGESEPLGSHEANFEIQNVNITQETKYLEPDTTINATSDHMTKEERDIFQTGKYASGKNINNFKEIAYKLDGGEISEIYSQIHMKCFEDLSLNIANKNTQSGALVPKAEVPNIFAVVGVKETGRVKEDFAKNKEENLALLNVCDIPLSMVQMSLNKSQTTTRPVLNLNRDPLTHWQRLVDSNIESFFKKFYSPEVNQAVVSQFISNSTNTMVSTNQVRQRIGLVKNLKINFDPLTLPIAQDPHRAEIENGDSSARNNESSHCDLNFNDRHQGIVHPESFRPEFQDNIKDEMVIDEKQDQKKENDCGEKLKTRNDLNISQYFSDYCDNVHSTQLPASNLIGPTQIPDILECTQGGSVHESYNSQRLSQEGGVDVGTSFTSTTSEPLKEFSGIKCNTSSHLANSPSSSDEDDEGKESFEEVADLSTDSSWESVLSDEECFTCSGTCLSKLENKEGSHIAPPSQDFEIVLKPNPQSKDRTDWFEDRKPSPAMVNSVTADMQLTHDQIWQSLSVPQQYDNTIRDIRWFTMNENSHSFLKIVNKTASSDRQISDEVVIDHNDETGDKQNIFESSKKRLTYLQENIENSNVCTHYIEENFKPNSIIEQHKASNIKTFGGINVKHLNKNPTTQWKRLMETNIDSMLKKSSMLNNLTTPATVDTKNCESRKGSGTCSNNGPRGKPNSKSSHPLTNQLHKDHSNELIVDSTTFELKGDNFNVKTISNDTININEDDRNNLVNGIEQLAAFELTSVKHEEEGAIKHEKMCTEENDSQRIESFLSDIQNLKTTEKVTHLAEIVDKYSCFSTLESNSKLNLSSKKDSRYTSLEYITTRLHQKECDNTREKVKGKTELDSCMVDSAFLGVENMIGFNKPCCQIPEHVLLSNNLFMNSSGGEGKEISDLFDKYIYDTSNAQCSSTNKENKMQKRDEVWPPFVSDNDKKVKSPYNFSSKNRVHDYVSLPIPKLENSSDEEFFIFLSQPTPTYSTAVSSENKIATDIKTPSTLGLSNKSLQNEKKIDSHIKYLPTQDIKSIKSPEICLSNHSDSIFYMSPELQNLSRVSPILEGKMETINVAGGLNNSGFNIERVNKNVIDKIENQSENTIKENRVRQRTMSVKLQNHNMSSETWCTEIKFCSLLDIVDGFSLVSSVTVVPPAPSVLEKSMRCDMREVSCGTELSSIKSCENNSKTLKADGKTNRGFFALSNFIKNLFTVSNKRHCSSDSHERQEHVSVHFKGPPNLRDRDGLDMYVVENEKTFREQASSIRKTSKKRQKRKSSKNRLLLPAQYKPKRKSTNHYETFHGLSKESDKLNDPIVISRKEIICTEELPASHWRNNGEAEVRGGFKADGFNFTGRKKSSQDSLDRTKCSSTRSKTRHLQELTVDTKRVPNDQNLSAFFTSSKTEDVSELSNTYSPKAVKIKDIVQTTGGLKIDSQNEVLWTKEPSGVCQSRAPRFAGLLQPFDCCTGSESEEDTESAGTDIEPSDMLKYSLECLLEVVVQRGKVEQAFVAQFEGEILAKSAHCDIRREDVLAIDRSLASTYQGMTRLSVFSEVFTCIRCQRASPSITGTSDRRVLVALRGCRALIVGVGLNSLPGSCIKEIEELAQVLRQRGL